MNKKQQGVARDRLRCGRRVIAGCGGALVFALVAGPAVARDIYVTPFGAGDKSGSSFAAAMPFVALDAAIAAAGPGGNVLLSSDDGVYPVASPISITSAGTAAAPVTITGRARNGAAARAEFVSNRRAPWVSGGVAGSEVFRLTASAHDLLFANLRFRNVGAAFRVAQNMARLTLNDMDGYNLGYFFYTYPTTGTVSATVTTLRVARIDVHGFSKAVVRLGSNSNDVVLDHLTGDSEQQQGGFAEGVQLIDTVHNVTVSASTMRNALDTVNSYWNGDGFATEKDVYDVRFIDCAAIGNADGGFDLKSTRTSLTRTIAEDNAHNYRVWGVVTIDGGMAFNPHVLGGTGAQFQFDVPPTGVLTIKNATIADAGSKTAVFRVQGKMTIGTSKVVQAKGATLFDASGVKQTLPAAMVATVTAKGIWSPGYRP